MKKDERFLKELEKKLGKISKKKKQKIIQKYRNIIDLELKNKKKITTILKELGLPSHVAKLEIEKTINVKKTLSSLKRKIKFKKIKYKIKKIFNFKKLFKNIFNNLKKINIKHKLKQILQNKKITNNKISKKSSKKAKAEAKLEKRKNKKENKISNKESLEENIIEEVIMTSSIVQENKNETKVQKIIRIILQIIGIIIIIILLFLFLWSSMFFTASIFAYLDGIKLLGINLILLAISMLTLWMLILVSKFVFRKKINFILSLLSIILIFGLCGVGISFTLKKLNEIDTVNDVSEKYSMETFYQKFNLIEDKEKIKYITFNSEYDTNYIIEYDKNLKDEFKIEVKYYECYYDLYFKNSTSNLYVSLKPEIRDSLSVFLENLKENKIFPVSELKRYTVRIIMNKKDKERIIINN